MRNRYLHYFPHSSCNLKEINIPYAQANNNYFMKGMKKDDAKPRGEGPLVENNKA